MHIATIGKIIITVLVALTTPAPWSISVIHLVSQKTQKRFYTKTIYAFHLLVSGVLVYLIFIYKGFVFAEKFSVNIPIRSLGALLLISALFIEWKTRKVLGTKALYGLVEIEKESSDSGLITKGIYAHARHPRYVEHSLWAFGLTLLSGYILLLVFAVYISIAFWIVTYLEEIELVRRFGEQYKIYQKKVPKFFIKL